MRYTVLALALAALLGAGVAWSAATEAPWESEPEITIVRHNHSEAAPPSAAMTQLRQCETMRGQLMQAQTEYAARVISSDMFQRGC